MFYTTSTDPTDIAKLILNVELGAIYFVNGMLVEKPQNTTHYTNDDKSSTVVIKPVFGYIYLHKSVMNDAFYSAIRNAVDKVIKDNPIIGKVLDSYSCISLMNTYGFTSLKIKYKESNSPVELQGRQISEFIYGGMFRFSWKISSIEDYINTYISKKITTDAAIHFRHSVISDKKTMWKNANGYVSDPKDMIFSYNFTLADLGATISLQDPFEIHRYIRNISNGSKYYTEYYQVPLYGELDPVEQEEVVGETNDKCCICSEKLYWKYYLMVYGEEKKPYCMFCTHIGTNDWSVGYTRIILHYNKPDKIIIMKSLTSIAEHISEFEELYKSFINDWINGNKQYIDKLFVITGTKKWIFNKSYVPLSDIVTDKNIMTGGDIMIVQE